MLRSENRILTTHAGSLPRRESLTAMLVKISRGEEVDRTAMLREIEESTRYVVEKQLEAGIDVGNNGEQSRESFFTYVQHRMTGFGGRSERPIMRDLVRYPSFRKLMAPLFQRSMVDLLHAPKAIGEVAYRDRAGVDLECADTLRILDDQQTKFAEPFMTAPSPGIIASAMLNEYYENYEKYVIAVAMALHTEYEYIVSKGFVLQVDCPDLAMERHTSYADRPLTEFLEYVELNIDAMNRALHGIAPDRVRMHVCWGNYDGPHTRDIPGFKVIPVALKAKPQCLLIEGANPRHEHEWELWKTAIQLPEDKVLIPGMIGSSTNYVEHPELVAQRILRYAGIVGRERVMGGTDCGFGTFAGFGAVYPDIAWLKLKSLADGAKIASQRLWGKAGSAN